jgi:uncharacterized protein
MAVVAALMLRAPHPGQVKTRLARTIGSEKATDVYRKLVEHQITQIPRDWQIEIHYTPADSAEEMRKWLGINYVYLAQCGGDLGQRLTNVMQTHFETDEKTPLAFLGADCPYLTTACLKEAIDKLVNCEAILIPAIDGGFCFLALGHLVEGMFDAIPWETAAVVDATRQRLREQRIVWEELSPLEDVDDEASWLRAQASYPI